MNGRGLFCYWDNPASTSHCRFEFDASVSDVLHKSRYHGALAFALSEEAERRKKLGCHPFGGGIVHIDKGDVVVSWLPYSTAVELMDDDLYTSYVDELQGRYLQVLSHFELAEIYEDRDLSGLFLPKPSRAYVSRNRRVFIVGQETRRENSCGARHLGSVSRGEIEESMDEALDFSKRKP